MTDRARKWHKSSSGRRRRCCSTSRRPSTRSTDNGVLAQRAQSEGLRAFLDEIHGGDLLYAERRSWTDRTASGYLERGAPGHGRGPSCLRGLLRLDSPRASEERTDTFPAIEVCLEGATERVEKVAFVDDLISVMVVVRLATLRSWIAHVTGIFENFGLKAKRRQAGDHCACHGQGKSRAQKVAKYLSYQLDIDGGSKREVEARLGKAKQAHVSSAARVWKSSDFSRQLKLRLCEALVFSVVAYALDAQVIAVGDLTRLERWQTK